MRINKKNGLVCTLLVRGAHECARVRARVCVRARARVRARVRVRVWTCACGNNQINKNSTKNTLYKCCILRVPISHADICQIDGTRRGPIGWRLFRLAIHQLCFTGMEEESQSNVKECVVCGVMDLASGCRLILLLCSRVITAT